MMTPEEIYERDMAIEEEAKKEKRRQLMIFGLTAILGTGLIASLIRIGMLNNKVGRLQTKLDDIHNIPDDFPLSKVQFVERDDSPIYSLQLFYAKENPVGKEDHKFMGEWASDDLESFTILKEDISKFIEKCSKKEEA